MTEKKFSENLSNNKALSDNVSNNFSPSLNVSNDFLGFGKAMQAYFDYKKYKISITEKNIESLHHLCRKDILTTQTETKKFIDKIFKLYEKCDVKISLATLRVIEYMDDELLGAIRYCISYYPAQYSNGEDFVKLAHGADQDMLKVINRHGVSFQEYGGGTLTTLTWKRGTVLEEIMEILNNQC